MVQSGDNERQRLCDHPLELVEGGTYASDSLCL
jgi:hypothetical protein